MNILMMTNTYTPLVGGLERSVRDFTMAFRRRGHRVLIVTPVFEGMPAEERSVVRLPAMQHFNGSDFSVKLPVPAVLTRTLRRFHPDIIHAHHPFLIGNTALRLAQTLKVPLVFTHHTLFEQYTHYLPVDSPASERFVIKLSTGYANLCDRVFAPSESVAELLKARGVRTPIVVVPTGVDVKHFAHGSARRARRALQITPTAWVIGHIGRLAPEKNLLFLAKTVAAYLRRDPRAHFLLIGAGPSQAAIQRIMAAAGVADRFHAPGQLRGQELVDAYHAMDVFVFASTSETQGLVLTEAMAAGVPVIALDAPGAREVVHDGINGRLLPSEHVATFVAALHWLRSRRPAAQQALRRAALATARDFSLDRCVQRALDQYLAILLGGFVGHVVDDSGWASAMRRMKAEWHLLKNMATATGAAMRKTKEQRVRT